jgi:hypothetical protein
MNTVLLRTSPAPASAELSEVAANDDALAPTVAVAGPLPPPAAAPQPVAVATSLPDAANSSEDDYYLGGYAGI